MPSYLRDKINLTQIKTDPVHPVQKALSSDVSKQENNWMSASTTDTIVPTSILSVGASCIFSK